MGPLRLYLSFSREKPLRFLSHLDMMRLWERALRRSDLPLRYSQGYHPRPRLSMAAPLTVGMTAEAEWMELELASSVALEEVCERLPAQLPAGLALHWVREASPQAPALGACLRAADYTVTVAQPPPLEQVRERVEQFLHTETWPITERHKGQERTRDLRAGVESLALGPWQAEQGCLQMRLRQGAVGHARPEKILQVLGISGQQRIHRQRLLFQGLPLSGQEVWCSDG